MSEEQVRDDESAAVAEDKKQEHFDRIDGLTTLLVIIGCVLASAFGSDGLHGLMVITVWATICIALFDFFRHFSTKKRWYYLGGLGLVATIACIFWALHERSSAQIKINTPDKPSPEKGETLPKDTRELLDIAPEKLLGFFKKYNNAQAEELVKPYIGKWLRLSGKVAEVNRDSFPAASSGIRGVRVMLQVTTGAESYFFSLTHFETQRWIDRAIVLPRGENITVFGQIDDVDPLGITLHNCEIIE